MQSDEIIETMARAGAKAGLEAGGRRYSAKDVAPGTIHHSEALFIIRAALSAAEAAGWAMMPAGLVEQAFRDGLAYGNNVEDADPDLAWQQSRVRAMSEDLP